MRKIVTVWQLVFILLNILFIGHADGLSGQILFTPDEIKSANTAATANYMSDEEKNVILIMNLARIDGQKFYQSYILSFVNRQNSLFSTKILANNSYLLSLKSDLQKIKGTMVMLPYKNLCLSAAFHANDMGKIGSVSHDSSDGTTCEKRIKRFFPDAYCWSENCSYGLSSAIDIICQLLIDNGIASLGHRTNILNPSQRIVGVSIAPHKIYGCNCVIDFSCNSIPQ